MDEQNWKKDAYEKMKQALNVVAKTPEIREFLAKTDFKALLQVDQALGATREDVEEEARHPEQPLVKDDHGTIRFKENKVVSWMLEQGRAGRRFDLNTISGMFSDEEMYQFSQLIGYSHSGWGGLSYVLRVHTKEDVREAVDRVIKGFGYMASWPTKGAGAQALRICSGAFFSAFQTVAGRVPEEEEVEAGEALLKKWLAPNGEELVGGPE
jgi:hypothetical protein